MHPQNRNAIKSLQYKRKLNWFWKVFQRASHLKIYWYKFRISSQNDPLQKCQRSNHQIINQPTNKLT